ncbi:DUF3592 domain-containing protein [Mameliella alba]|nr:DUF3592 domain-containing protein [Antarctobacter heliothermus]MBY6143415.1 DUF3592 domain-containing protein [Mameliella alba]MCA0952860.1 DUF3592 domain-containing protein [Mameliella alba]
MIWYVFKRGVGLALVLGLMGLAGLYAGVEQTLQSNAFADAPTVEGRVVRLEKFSRTQSGTTSTTYRVTVVATGDQHRESVNRAFYESLREGQTLPVLKLDGDPPQYRVEPARLRASSIWALAIGVLAVAGAAALGRFGWQSGRRAWRLDRQGVRTEAKITELVQSGIVHKLAVSFDDRAGQRQEVQVARMQGAFAPGDTVEILYDPEAPHNARLANAPG